MKRGSPSFREERAHRCLGRGGRKGSWPALGHLPLDPGTGASPDPSSVFRRESHPWVDPTSSGLCGHRDPHPSFATGNSPRIIQSVELEPRRGILVIHQAPKNLRWHLRALNGTLSMKERSIFAERRECWTSKQEASTGSLHILARGRWWSHSK